MVNTVKTLKFEKGVVACPPSSYGGAAPADLHLNSPDVSIRGEQVVEPLIIYQTVHTIINNNSNTMIV